MLLICLFAVFASAFAVINSAEAQFFRKACDTTNVASASQALAGPWCTPADPCTWSGVTCDFATSSFAERVVLPNSAPLTGTLDVNNLSGLFKFELDCLDGDLQVEITSVFTNANEGTLERFVVRNCRHATGTLPATGASLVHLEIKSTSFGGNIPSQLLMSAPLLETLILSQSDFSGTLPADFGFLASLTHLDLSSNKLEGPVVESICELMQLETLLLHQNYLNEFPACVASLDPMMTCDLRHNFYCTNSPLPGDLLPCVAVDASGIAQDAAFDRCGVCGGSGKTCIDCAGSINGTAVFDECGVCDGPGGLCLDCAGVENGTSVVDDCGVCGGDSSSCVDCAGVVNGHAVYDLCDVCDGDDSSCVDCLGMLYGTAQYDLCDVCAGDSSTCMDCNGILFGTSVYDECDRCDGDGIDCVIEC